MAYGGVTIEGRLGVETTFHVIDDIKFINKDKVTWTVNCFKDKAWYEAGKQWAKCFYFEMDITYEQYCDGFTPGDLYVAGKDIIPYGENTKIFENATHVE